MKNILTPSGLLLLVLLFISCSGKNVSEEIKNKYGIAYNPVRQKIPMELVDASMKFVEDIPGERYIFIKQDETGMKSPGYTYKTLTIDTSGSLTMETDYFINPQEKLYLIFSHDYYHGHTTINVQVIDENNFSNSSTEVQLPEADSILQAWGTKVNSQ